MDNEKIKKIIEDFLNKLTVEFNDIEISKTELHPIFLIKAGDSGVLIGNNGETLRALSYIIKQIVEKNNLDKEVSKTATQFLLDVNGYNAKKITELKDQAKILAERARMFKSNVEMNPMNAYERMIIHSAFADDNEIETTSEGEGRMRRIVLKYKS